MQTRLISVMTAVAMAAACGIGGFALGQAKSHGIDSETKQLLRRDAEQMEALRAITQRCGDDREAARAIGSIDEQSLSRLADLVASRLESHAKPAPEAHTVPTAPSPPPPSAESQAAIDKANSILDGAIAGGVWRDQESAQFRQLLPHMDGPQSGEVVRKLVVAINDGTVAVRTTGPAF
jgi:hypothetical protein